MVENLVDPKWLNALADIVEKISHSDTTMLSTNGLMQNAISAHLVCSNGIKGDIVECGVWRGGSALSMAKVFDLHGRQDALWLYDTWEGMTEVGEHDVSIDRRTDVAEGSFRTSDLECMELLLDNTEQHIIMRKGDVRDTLSHEGNLPDEISILRLDTDFYDSTKVELEVLWPRLTIGGYLIVDDYHYWKGSRKATDEFMESAGVVPEYFRYDYGVILKKL